MGGTTDWRGADWGNDGLEGGRGGNDGVSSGGGCGRQTDSGRGEDAKSHAPPSRRRIEPCRQVQEELLTYRCYKVGE